MKRVGLWTIGIGLFITVGLITVKQGYPAGHKKNTHEQKEHATTCTPSMDSTMAFGCGIGYDHVCGRTSL